MKKGRPQKEFTIDNYIGQEGQGIPIEKYRARMEQLKELKSQQYIAGKISENMQRRLDESMPTAEELKQILDKIFKTWRERAAQAKKVITEFVQSEKFKRLALLFDDIAYWFNPKNPLNYLDVFWLSDFIKNIDELQPFIEAKVKELKRKRILQAISFEEFIHDSDENGKYKKSFLDDCIEQANAARAAREKQKIDSQKFGSDLQDLAHFEQLRSILPRRYVMANNPITNSLAGRTDSETGELIPIVNNGAFDLPVLKSGKKGEVTAYTMVTLGPESGIELTGRTFTGYDRCVLNSVITLWEAGNETITAEMVCRAMANKTDSEKISPQQQGAITKSLEKMRYIHVFANLSEEMQKRKISFNGKPITDFVIDNFLLILDKVKVTAGGTTKTAYHIVKEPILLSYSKMTGQLLTVKADLMDIKKTSKGKISSMSISTTETRQTIKEYLLRRIEVMKHARRQKYKNQSNRILFDTLYRETGMENASKTERSRTRDYVYRVLDYWTAKKYIDGYTVVTEKQKKQGIDVHF